MPWVTGWSTNSTMYLNGILGIYKRPAKSATFAPASQTRHYASDCFTACSCSMLFPHCSHIVPSFPQFSAQQLNSSTAQQLHVATSRRSLGSPWFPSCRWRERNCWRWSWRTTPMPSSCRWRFRPFLSNGDVSNVSKTDKPWEKQKDAGKITGKAKEGGKKNDAWLSWLSHWILEESRKSSKSSGKVWRFHRERLGRCFNKGG